MLVTGRILVVAVALFCGLHEVAGRPGMTFGEGASGVENKDGVVSDRDWRKREAHVKHFERGPGVEANV